MANVAFFDPEDPTVANRVTKWKVSVDPTPYLNSSNKIVWGDPQYECTNPMIAPWPAGVSQTSKPYHAKVINGNEVVAMTTQEADAIDAAEADAAQDAAIDAGRDGAKDGILDAAYVPEGVLARALIQEIADLHSVDPATVTASIKARIDAGDADE